MTNKQLAAMVALVATISVVSVAAEDALLDQARGLGLKKFVEFGCAGCHNGVAMGGQTYQKFGITQEYWLAIRSKEIDKGRCNDTKDPNDLYLFKVPPLRNVTSAPCDRTWTHETAWLLIAATG